MKKSILAIVAVAVAMTFGSSLVQARPNFPPVVAEAHPDYKIATDKDQRCNICHVQGEEKKVRNAFGAEMGKALGEKSVKDAAKIKAALTTAEGKPSAEAGKTFGDLIKAGQLPATK